MKTADWSLVLAIIALVISIWARLETFYFSKRQQSLDQVKRVGEALLSAQILKNTLSNNIDSLELYIKEFKTSQSQEIDLKSLNELLEKLNSEYKVCWDSVRLFEEIIVKYKSGTLPIIIPTAIEAGIAHFNQRKELAMFDIEYLKKLYNETKGS